MIFAENTCSPSSLTPRLLLPLFLPLLQVILFTNNSNWFGILSVDSSTRFWKTLLRCGFLLRIVQGLRSTWTFSILPGITATPNNWVTIPFKDGSNNKNNINSHMHIHKQTYAQLSKRCRQTFDKSAFGHVCTWIIFLSAAKLMLQVLQLTERDSGRERELFRTLTSNSKC